MFANHEVKENLAGAIGELLVVYSDLFDGDEVTRGNDMAQVFHDIVSTEVDDIIISMAATRPYVYDLMYQLENSESVIYQDSSVDVLEQLLKIATNLSKLVGSRNDENLETVCNLLGIFLDIAMKVSNNDVEKLASTFADNCTSIGDAAIISMACSNTYRQYVTSHLRNSSLGDPCKHIDHVEVLKKLVKQYGHLELIRVIMKMKDD